ncbi:MAG: hypothetical protein QFC55_01905 [Chloroflexota bacterium]|nr:hypothetical protein [Chloroflexota bacterium]
MAIAMLARMTKIDRLSGLRMRNTVRFVAHLVKEQRAMARAARRMPKPVPWEWAKPRLLPLLSGPAIDPPGLPTMRTAAGPGCAVEFGLDLSGVFPVVDALVAERWECDAAQLLEVSLANLRQRTSRLSPANLSAGALSGRMTRVFRQPGWAASLVLLEDELVRLFGAHDQFIAVPGRSLLMSFPIEMPLRIVADTVVDFEAREVTPLLYEPFLITNGRLSWQPPDEDLPEGDDIVL